MVSFFKVANPPGARASKLINLRYTTDMLFFLLLLLLLLEERYIAARAYSANEPDELGFQKGVVVDVLQKNVDGWWLIR